MADTLAQLLQLQGGGDGEAAGGMQALLSPGEAERMIEQLQTFGLADVGSPRWQTQREWISRMNIQAHHNAGTHSDEFIVELLVSLDKVKALVHDLLVIEAWKQHVLPHLKRHLAHKVDMSFTYLVLYHECTLANLLELVLYHSHALEALPEDHLLELCDWAYRKLTFLVSPAGHAQAHQVERSAQQLLAMTKEQELEEKVADTDFGAAVCAVTITRYLCDGVTRLPMGLLSRLLATNDTPMALVALLDAPPWVRKRAGRTEQYRGNDWQPVAPADRLKLTQLDAQVWLSLNSLVVEPRCRAKYAPDEWRRDKLLGLKRYLHELLFDQLPVLKDLQRTLDEMALGVGLDTATHKAAALLLEAVPEVRAALLRDAPDGRALALQQARTHFSEEAARKAAHAQLAAFMKALDFMVDTVAPDTGADAAAGSGAATQQPGLQGPGVPPLPGPVRVSCWRKAHDSGVYESWCEYRVEVDPARPPEHVALEDLQGLRYRLLPMDPAANRALPTQGKVTVRIGGFDPNDPTTSLASATDPEPLVAQALLQLPEIPVKSAAGEKPPIVWVNIGLLAEDGLVLQLKLKKTDTGAERDKVSGIWYTYHPVGGALTVLHSMPSTDCKASTASTTQPAEEQERLVPAVGLAGISSAQPAGTRAAVTEVSAQPAKGRAQPGKLVAPAAASQSSSTKASRGSHQSCPPPEAPGDVVSLKAAVGPAAVQSCSVAAAAVQQAAVHGVGEEECSMLDLPD